jgi:hypothetical protein
MKCTEGYYVNGLECKECSTKSSLQWIARKEDIFEYCGYYGYDTKPLQKAVHIMTLILWVVL